MTTTKSTLHMWMNQRFPRVGRCEMCGRTDRKTEYASAGHLYTKNRADWFELCRQCHQAFDGYRSRRGKTHTAATKARIAAAVTKTHCKHGHEFTEANTYRDRDGRRHCRACGRAASRRHYWKGVTP